MGGVGPGPACAPWGSMRGPGPALRVPPSHPGECLGGGVRVYLWRTPPAWGSGLGSAYARTLGNKPENVPGAAVTPPYILSAPGHFHFWSSREWDGPSTRQGIAPGRPEGAGGGFLHLVGR